MPGTGASTSGDLQARYERAASMLERRGQQHVLRWWADLDDASRRRLLAQVESMPWDLLDGLIESHVLRRPPQSIPSGLEPAPVYPAVPRESDRRLYRDAAARGAELIAAGKVAPFTVAGGQGTRLGVDGPKGLVEVTPVKRKTLLRLFAEMIVAAGRRYGVSLPWCIMTSPANHEPTVAYLAEHDHFGLPAEDVILFSQGMLPSFDLDGKVLMDRPDSMALAPDGHGGSLKALVASGALATLRERDVQIISYFQIDNPLVQPMDRLFVGLHARSGSEMSTKVARKADDQEKVGNLCLQDGRLTVIEYSNLPEELAAARNDDGSRRFDLGNLAIHLLDVAFVQRVIERDFRLPFQRAEKKVAFVDAAGRRHEPDEPNAVKLETFVFDALPLAERPMLLEVDRAEEFSPVKNPTGVDSLETAVRDQVRRAARWLESAGATVPRTAGGEPDATLEIAPALALDAEELAARLEAPPVIERGSVRYFDVQ